MKLENLTFKGGVHIPEYKDLTKDKSIENAIDPKVVYISLHQHVGSPCEAIVSKGDIVKVGQKIGDSKAFLSAPVHSSVSGVVKSISKMYTPDGRRSDCVVIESDGLGELHESIKPITNLDTLSKEEIINLIKDAGIVGLGGAGYPMHAKLVASDDSKIDTAILNGAECEPYLTVDHRVMLEEPEAIIKGLKLIMHCLDLETGYIGIEDNKKDAIEALSSSLKDENIKIVSLKTKFPQGDSYRMVDAILDRKVPSGGRCKDVGTIVSNVSTALAVAELFKEGKPLYERTITVTGNGVRQPKNLKVKIGTTIREIIEQCGGFNGEPGKIIAGGPMTGLAQFSLDTPIIKTTSAIIVLTLEEATHKETEPCIKCGKCLQVCPISLQPLLLSAYALKDMFEMTEEYNVEECIQCGACSFICPSKRPLTESIRHAQREIKLKRKKSKK